VQCSARELTLAEVVGAKEHVVALLTDVAEQPDEVEHARVHDGDHAPVAVAGRMRVKVVPARGSLTPVGVEVGEPEIGTHLSMTEQSALAHCSTTSRSAASVSHVPAKRCRNCEADRQRK